VNLADGQQIALTTVGTGPDLLAVPGGPARAATYLGTLGGLDQHFSLHLIDPRGSGGSQPAEPETLTVAQLSRDLAEIVPLAGLHQPAILAHSFGARLVLSALAADPTLASALVLVTPAPLVVDDTLTAGRDDVLTARAEDPDYADAVEAGRALPTARPRDRAFLEQETRKLTYGRWDAAAQAHADSARSQVAVRTAMTLRNDPDGWAVPDLSALHLPVLVLAGALDFATPPAAVHALHVTLPTSTYVELEGAGHYPWLDDPEAFTVLISDFLSGEGLA
jgi:pimeloyl-ACP methyl ester carboxylesterase